MPEGTSRFSYKGKQTLHYVGTSTFSEYTVLPEMSVAKISKEATLSKVSVMGCAVPTGIGAVRNPAKVKPGSSVAVFGLEAVGIAVIQGSVLKGVSRIVGVDKTPTYSRLPNRSARQHASIQRIIPHTSTKSWSR